MESARGRDEGDEVLKGYRDQVMEGFVYQSKKLGVYSNWNRKPLNNLKQEVHSPWFMYLREYFAIHSWRSPCIALWEQSASQYIELCLLYILLGGKRKPLVETDLCVHPHNTEHILCITQDLWFPFKLNVNKPWTCFLFVVYFFLFV